MAIKIKTNGGKSLIWLRPWLPLAVPVPGDGGDEMAFFFDGVTYTLGELTAGSGARTLDVELTSGGNAITTGTGSFMLCNLSDANFNGSTYFKDVLRINGITGGAWGTIADASGDYQYVNWIFIPAADGHVKCTLTYANASASPESCYPCVILPSGGIDISAEFVVPATGE